MAMVQLSLNEICRGCMSTNQLKTLVQSQMATTFGECVNLEISLNDGLPTKLCTDCWDQCSKWSNFRAQCRKTDSTLRGLIMISTGQPTTNSAIPESMNDQEVIDAPFEDMEVADLTELELHLQEEVKMEEAPPGEATADDPVEFIELVPSRTDDSSSAFVCKYCSKKCRKEETLEAHERQHEGKKPYVCKICDQEFNSRLPLRSHMIKHSNKTFDCPDCDKTFAYPQLLGEHRKRIHTTPTKFFPCDKCGKEFTRQQTRDTHMLTHTDHRPVQCPKCSMRFKSEFYLKMHEVRHSETKNFVCPEEECGKAFYTKSELNLHRRGVHSDNKEHPCKVCSKSFIKLSQLVTHNKKAHSKENKKFKCENCPREFDSSQKLHTHMAKEHSKVKFECEKCKKVFRLKHSLVVHMKNHK